MPIYRTKDYIQVQNYHSPLGEMQLAVYDERLCLCDWIDCTGFDGLRCRLERGLEARCVEASSPVYDEAKWQLDAYFKGELRSFDLPLHFVGTDFQIRVWQELCRIPYGRCISYAELAKRIGNPSGVRAVAQANAMNMMPIVVPCHRVLGSARLDMGGFSSGLERKHYLLNLEQGLIMPSLSFE